MTVEEVEKRVADIEAGKGDDEGAHAAEDDLWEAVLKAIASNQPSGYPHMLAAAALKTREIDFSRWCA